MRVPGRSFCPLSYRARLFHSDLAQPCVPTPPLVASGMAHFVGSKILWVWTNAGVIGPSSQREEDSFLTLKKALCSISSVPPAVQPGNHPSVFSIVLPFLEAAVMEATAWGLPEWPVVLSHMPFRVVHMSVLAQELPPSHHTSCIHAPVKDVLFASGFWQLLIK